MKRIGLIIVLMGMAGQMLAQQKECNAKFSGTVHNSNHEALFGVAIYIPELKKGFITDEQGRYFFEDVCFGKYTLICRHINCKEKAVEIQVDKNELEQNIDLEDVAIHLEEIAITGQQISLENQTQAIATLNQEILDKNAGKSLGDALKNITGVNTLQTGASIAKPVIHGLHSNRILILNNGIRQEGQQWGSEHAPEIDPFIATRLTVVKGANAVRYGSDAIGGVILVEAPVLKYEKGISGEVNLIGTSNNRGGIFSSQIAGRFHPNFAWRVQGTFKKIGDAQTSNYNLGNTAFQEINFSGTLGYKTKNFNAELFFSSFNTDLSILKAAHTGNLDDLERAINASEPLESYNRDFSYEIGLPKQKVGHQLLKFNLQWYLQNIGTFKLQYGGQFNTRREFDARLGDDNRAKLFLELSTHTLDASLEHQLAKKIEGNIGFNLSLQDNYNVPETGIRPLIPQYTSHGAGFFWIEKYVKARWEVELGLRYDYKNLNVLRYDRSNNLLNPSFNMHNVSWSAGWLYKFNHFWNFRSNIASAWRPPNSAELFSEGLHHGTATIEEGLALNQIYDLKNEQAYKWISTLDFNNIFEGTNKGVSFEISAYLNYIQNFIYLQAKDVRLTIRGAFPVMQYTQSNANFNGLDASFKWFFVRNIAFQGKASLVRAKNTITDGFYINIPTDRFEYSFLYDLPKWKNLEKIYFSMGLQQISRQFRSPEVFTVAQIRAALTDENIKIPAQGFDFKAAPAGYFLWNIEGGFTKPFQKQKLAISFTISNLWNVAYRDYMNRFRYFADDTGRNFTLRLKHTF